MSLKTHIFEFWKKICSFYIFCKIRCEFCATRSRIWVDPYKCDYFFLKLDKTTTTLMECENEIFFSWAIFIWYICRLFFPHPMMLLSTSHVLPNSCNLEFHLHLFTLSSCLVMAAIFCKRLQNRSVNPIICCFSRSNFNTNGYQSTPWFTIFSTDTTSYKVEPRQMVENWKNAELMKQTK